MGAKMPFQKCVIDIGKAELHHGRHVRQSSAMRLVIAHGKRLEAVCALICGNRRRRMPIIAIIDWPSMTLSNRRRPLLLYGTIVAVHAGRQFQEALGHRNGECRRGAWIIGLYRASLSCELDQLFDALDAVSIRRHHADLRQIAESWRRRNEVFDRIVIEIRDKWRPPSDIASDRTGQQRVAVGLGFGDVFRRRCRADAPGWFSTTTIGRGFPKAWHRPSGPECPCCRRSESDDKPDRPGRVIGLGADRRYCRGQNQRRG